MIRHKQRPSFLSSPNTSSENSNSVTSLIAASSSSIPRIQESNTPAQSSSLFLPIDSSNSDSNSSSSSSNSSDSDSESSSSSSSDNDGQDDDDDDDDDERNILFALQEAQQQRLTNTSSLQPTAESTSNRLSITY